jgi:hypothetical protein
MMAARAAKLAGIPVEMILEGKIVMAADRCPHCGQKIPNGTPPEKKARKRIAR